MGEEGREREGGRGKEREGEGRRVGGRGQVHQSFSVYPTICIPVPQSVTLSIYLCFKQGSGHLCLLDDSDLVQEMFPSFADTGRQLSAQGPA